jgi:hypothetical protein
MASNNKIDLNVVVSGAPVTVEANLNQPLHAILGKSLELAHVAGDGSPDDWIFTDAQGNTLDKTRKIGELGIVGGATVFLTRKAGGAG